MDVDMELWTWISRCGWPPWRKTGVCRQALHASVRSVLGKEGNWCPGSRRGVLIRTELAVREHLRLLRLNSVLNSYFFFCSFQYSSNYQVFSGTWRHKEVDGERSFVYLGLCLCPGLLVWRAQGGKWEIPLSCKKQRGVIPIFVGPLFSSEHACLTRK